MNIYALYIYVYIRTALSIGIMHPKLFNLFIYFERLPVTGFAASLIVWARGGRFPC